MKIQLDFDNKTITLEADCELKEFIPVIQRILPDWQKWTLKMEVITNWINPIVYPPYPPFPSTDNPIIAWGSGTTEGKVDCGHTLTSEIVNIDVN
jgi:hypothetical protein